MLYAFDFDGTLTSESTISHKASFSNEIQVKPLNGNIQSNLRNKDKLESLLRSLREKGHTLYIVSNNPSQALIENYLQALLGDGWPQIINGIIIGDGCDRLKTDKLDSLAEQHQCCKNEIVLVDDSCRQCQNAATQGFNAVFAKCGEDFCDKIENNKFYQPVTPFKPKLDFNANKLFRKRKLSNSSHTSTGENDNTNNEAVSPTKQVKCGAVSIAPNICP